MLGLEVVLEGGDVEDFLGEKGAEIDDLEGADDGIQSGELEAVGGEVNLLDGDGALAGDGGEKLLKLLEALAVGVLDGGVGEDDAEVLAETALDGVVQGEIDGCAGGFSLDDGSAVVILGGGAAALAGGCAELLLGLLNGGGVGSGGADRRA